MGRPADLLSSQGRGPMRRAGPRGGRISPAGHVPRRLGDRTHLSDVVDTIKAKSDRRQICKLSGRNIHPHCLYDEVAHFFLLATGMCSFVVSDGKRDGRR